MDMGYNFQLGQLEDAGRLVKKYHYSHAMTANICTVGTFHEDGGLFGDMGKCVAACIMAYPANQWREEVVELARLVRIEDKNITLTQLISLTCKATKKRGYDLLISYADWKENHHGGIYQAASWNYDGKRKRRIVGLSINGSIIHCRNCNHIYGTSSATELKKMYPEWEIEPNYDVGKYLYWKPLNRKGKAKAKRLGLMNIPYPKPNKSQGQLF